MPKEILPNQTPEAIADTTFRKLQQRDPENSVSREEVHNVVHTLWEGAKVKQFIAPLAENKLLKKEPEDTPL